MKINKKNQFTYSFETYKEKEYLDYSTLFDNISWFIDPGDKAEWTIGRPYEPSEFIEASPFVEDIEYYYWPTTPKELDREYIDYMQSLEKFINLFRKYILPEHVWTLKPKNDR